MNSSNFVQARPDGDVLVVMPLRNIGNFEHEATQREWQSVIQLMDQHGLRNAVLDFGAIAYFGSAVLEYIVLLSREVVARQGRFAICNLSAIGAEIVTTTGFHKLGTVVATRAEALDAVRSAG